MPWTEVETTSNSAYLPCSLNDTDTDNTNRTVYFVSLRAKNGAGLWSSVTNSSPIIVVQEDVTGSFSSYFSFTSVIYLIITYINNKFHVACLVFCA